MEDLTGKRFGHLVVTGFSHKIKIPSGWRYLWDATCDCGSKSKPAANKLRSGATRSCGCILKQRWHRESNGTGKAATPTYTSWQAMRKRCLYPKHVAFHNYGGRGIRVCKRWDSYQNFLEDMGERPEGMTLDRIDVDGHYEPKNCRWASMKTQRANQRPATQG